MARRKGKRTLGSSFSFLGIGTIVPFLHAEGMQQLLRQIVKRVLRTEQQKLLLSMHLALQVASQTIFFWAMVANLTSSGDAVVSQQRSKLFLGVVELLLGDFSTCSAGSDECVLPVAQQRHFSTDESTLLPSTTCIGMCYFFFFLRSMVLCVGVQIFSLNSESRLSRLLWICLLAFLTIVLNFLLRCLYLSLNRDWSILSLQDSHFFSAMVSCFLF